MSFNKPFAFTPRPVIVFITSRFPWPLTNGFAIKNYWLLRALSNVYRVRLHIIGRSRPDATSFTEVEKYCEVVHFHNPSLLDTTFAVFRTLVSHAPAQLALFHSRVGFHAVKQDLSDAVAAISSAARTAPYLLDFKGPIFMDLADSLGQAYTRDSHKMRGMLKKLVYKEEGRRMVLYEEFLVRRCQGTFFFNDTEANMYKGLGPVRVVPHGVHPRLFEESGTDDQFSDGVVIFGKMDYEPNVDAVLWFVHNVLPLLPAEVRLYVIGFQPAHRILTLAANQTRVVVVGFMENPYPALRGAIASICPLQMGGGIQNKVLESIAVGAYTIISPLAARPLSSLELSGIVVCDKPIEWVDAINAAIAAPDRHRSDRLKGRKYALERFSWVAYGDAVLEQIEFGRFKDDVQQR